MAAHLAGLVSYSFLCFNRQVLLIELEHFDDLAVARDALAQQSNNPFGHLQVRLVLKNGLELDACQTSADCFVHERLDLGHARIIIEVMCV